MSKIFAIGLPKTGTSSLAEALQILGFSVVRADKSMSRISAHDAATHEPIHERFEELDQQYPGSRFIYTTRCPDEWMKSVQRHEKYLQLQGRREGQVTDTSPITAFAEPATDRTLLDLYDEHEKHVKNYFHGRPQDLLVIDVCAGDAWEKLCPFLEKPVPRIPFPFSNAGVGPLRHYLGPLSAPFRRPRRLIRWVYAWALSKSLRDMPR